MSEISVGDVVARLKADTSDFVRGVQQAAQQLQSGLQPTVGQTSAILQQFNAAVTAAGQNAARLATVIQQGQSLLAAFNVTTTASGQVVNQFGQALHSQAIANLQGLNAALHLATQAQQAAQQAAQAHTQALTQQATQAASTGSVLGSVLSTALGVAGGLGIATSLQGLVRELVDAGKSIVDVGLKMQGLQLAFKGIGGSAETGAADFGFITRESQRLGLELLSTATTFRNFEAAAKGTILAGQPARDIFTGFATAARGLGIQGAELTRVFFALDRMMQTNVINMRELRQLSMAMPGSMEAFAHALGTTTAGLAEMTKSGTLLATEALPAVAREMLKLSSGIAGDIGTQASTAIARLGNEFVLLKNRIAESGLLEAVKAIADAATGVLEAGRKASDQRTRESGGLLPLLPGNMQGLAPDIQARQRLIQQLQDQLHPSAVPGMLGASGIPATGGLSGALSEDDRERTRQRVRALIEEQHKAVQAFQKGLEIEAPNPLPAPGPVETQTKSIQALLDEGRKKLADIDLNAEFIPSLTTAEDKLKSWQDTLKAIREELTKLSVPLRQAQLSSSATPSPFRDLIAPLATARSIDPLLVEALVAQESRNDPNAVSRKGAKGLMQLMPATAAQYGAGGKEFDPETNLRAGIAYLADLLKMFSGDVVKALTAYNAGPAGKGIPQATGENATFATQVLARMPTGIGSILAQGSTQEAALRAAVDAGKPDPERRAQAFATGRAVLAAYDEQVRQNIADEHQHQEAIDKVTMSLAGQQDTAFKALQTLAAQYIQTKEARDTDTASTLAATLANSQYADQVPALVEAVKDSAKVLATVPQRQAEAASSFLKYQQSQHGETYVESLRTRLAELQTPKDTEGAALFGPTRSDLARRAVGDKTPLTDDQKQQAKALQDQITAQERLNYLGGVFDQLAGAAAQSWVTGLQGIIQGTESVGTAFKAMAASVLQSLAQIASQEGFRALFRAGFGLLTSALGGGVSGAGTTAANMDSAVAFSQSFQSAQGGAIVNRPTAILAGENPAMNPEYVVNHPQMQALMQRAVQAAPSAGGQALGGAGITIINVATRGEAEAQAAQQRAMGRQVVINEVLGDLQLGESSKINRMMRTLQR